MAYVGTDWAPVEPGEVRTLTLDFTSKLQAGETIVSDNNGWGISTVPMPAMPVVDVFAFQRFSNGQFSGMIASVTFSTPMARTLYVIAVHVTTNLGNVYSLYSRIQCLSPAAS